MPNLALLSLLLLTPAPQSLNARRVTIDGDSSYPAAQQISYSYDCPDGRVILSVYQKDGGYPLLHAFKYENRSLLRTARPSVEKALRQLRTLESVSPRCLTGGGVRLLMGGLPRAHSSLQRQIITVRVDRHGIVSVR